MLQTWLLVLSASQVTQKRPSNQVGNDLSNCPVNRQDSQQVLVSRRQKFEKDGRVDRQIATNTKGPEAVEDANSCKVGSTSSHHSPERSQAEGKVEGDFPTEDVASEAPEDGTSQETNVLGQSQERRAVGGKLVVDGCEDEGCDDWPKVIRSPTKADDEEELPLIPSHANLLNLRRGMR